MKYHISFDIEFRENPYKGKYIAFEGIDGVGKTTQAAILKKYLQKKGREVIFTKEPTQNPPIGTLIHDFIKGKIKFPSVSIQYLFAADREIHLKDTVEPALKNGKIVISDRCFWSSVAYGILDKKEDFYKMKKKHEYYETREKLKNIKAGYDWLAEKFPKEIVAIDGEKPVEEVTAQILKNLELRFKI